MKPTGNTESATRHSRHLRQTEATHADRQKYTNEFPTENKFLKYLQKQHRRAWNQQKNSHSASKFSKFFKHFLEGAATYTHIRQKNNSTHNVSTLSKILKEPQKEKPTIRHQKKKKKIPTALPCE